MTLAHVHLLLNHFPVIGTVIGVGLFLVALARKNDELKRVSLEVFFVIALLTLPAYLSGNAAQEAIADSPGVSQPLIAAHQDAAVLALVLMSVTGALAWLGLWQFRRNPGPSRTARWNLSAVLVLSIVTVAAMAYTANLGGEIRHPEIVSGQGPAGRGRAGGSEIALLKASSIASFVTARAWTWPASETLHFIGLCLLFSAILPANLRMLGLMKNVPFAALHHLLPWAIVGFAINGVTGMLFFITAPDQYTQNPAFYWKMLFIFLAGGNLLYLTAFDGAWSVGPGETASRTAKVIAASSIFLWFGVIFWGRLMPFLGLTF
jgi:uncharacterized membrane protein